MHACSRTISCFSFQLLNTQNILSRLATLCIAIDIYLYTAHIAAMRVWPGLILFVSLTTEAVVSAQQGIES